MGLFSRKGDPGKDLAKALAVRGTQGRATVVSMRETGNEREKIAKEIEFVLDLELPEQGTVRVTTLQYMNRFNAPQAGAKRAGAGDVRPRGPNRMLMVEGHARYRTDVIGGDIVVVEVEDVRLVEGTLRCEPLSRRLFWPQPLGSVWRAAAIKGGSRSAEPIERSRKRVQRCATSVWSPPTACTARTTKPRWSPAKHGPRPHRSKSPTTRPPAPGSRRTQEGLRQERRRTLPVLPRHGRKPSRKRSAAERRPMRSALSGWRGVAVGLCPGGGGRHRSRPADRPRRERTQPGGEEPRAGRRILPLPHLGGAGLRALPRAVAPAAVRGYAVLNRARHSSRSNWAGSVAARKRSKTVTKRAGASTGAGGRPHRRLSRAPGIVTCAGFGVGDGDDRVPPPPQTMRIGSASAR